jgi:hypothetical protein
MRVVITEAFVALSALLAGAMFVAELSEASHAAT